MLKFDVENGNLDIKPKYDRIWETMKDDIEGLNDDESRLINYWKLNEVVSNEAGGKESQY